MVLIHAEDGELLGRFPVEAPAQVTDLLESVPFLGQEDNLAARLEPPRGESGGLWIYIGASEDRRWIPATMMRIVKQRQAAAEDAR
jgi:hypothetical protein